MQPNTKFCHLIALCRKNHQALINQNLLSMCYLHTKKGK